MKYERFEAKVAKDEDVIRVTPHMFPHDLTNTEWKSIFDKDGKVIGAVAVQKPTPADRQGFEPFFYSERS